MTSLVVYKIFLDPASNIYTLLEKLKLELTSIPLEDTEKLKLLVVRVLKSVVAEAKIEGTADQDTVLAFLDLFSKARMHVDGELIRTLVFKDEDGNIFLKLYILN